MAASATPGAVGDGTYSALATKPELTLGITNDSLAVANKLPLSSLNIHPETHQQALAQLFIAKQYIQKAQERDTAAAAAATPLPPSRSFKHDDEKRPLKLLHVVGSSDYSVDSMNSRENSIDSQSFLSKGTNGDSLHGIDEETSGESHHHGPPPEMTPDDYYQTPWYRLLLKRLPWLICLLLLQSFGALILNHYNTLISKHLVLNFFIPMMQGTSGNAGNQPGVMVTRALSLGQLYLPALLLKEGPVAIITATVLGAVAYLRIRFVYPDDPGSALSIALALFIAIILAVTFSILFSWLLHRISYTITCCDPADGAVPLLSTVSDVMSILVLMTIAERILPKPSDQ